MEKLTSMMLFYESAVQASININSIRNSNHSYLYRVCIVLRAGRTGDLDKGRAREMVGGGVIHNGRESRAPALSMAVMLLCVAPCCFMFHGEQPRCKTKAVLRNTKFAWLAVS